MKTAVVLVQLGTPGTLERRAVEKFIRSFLLDPMVLEMPPIIRYPLVSLIIAPLRSRVALNRYRQIWDPVKGSPLLYHTIGLENKLNKKTGNNLPVIAAFQYGTPNLHQQLSFLHDNGYNNLLIIPLYPQSAPSTTGAVQAAIEKEIAGWSVKPQLKILTPLWSRSGYSDLLARHIASYQPLSYDLVLFSYHGLPLKQAALGYSGSCEALTSELVHRLNIPPHKYCMAYQSRFGRGWTMPLTEQCIDQALANGIRSILIVAPSFTADCLETSWEIGISFRDRFLRGGGERFKWVRSFNDSDDWADWLFRQIESE